MQVPLAATFVTSPCGAAEGRTPVVRRRSVRLAVGEVIEVAVGIVGRAQGGLKPGMLVGRVIRDEVTQHLEPQLVGARDELVEVREGAVLRVDVVIVGDVVAMVLLRRGIEGREPDRVDAQAFQVVEPRGDARQVADAVVVGVGKAADVDLVKDRASPPGTRHRRQLKQEAGRSARPIERECVNPRFQPSAATTFENTLTIWFPMVNRITMTTIETRTRIKAYSTIPCPRWRLSPARNPRRHIRQSPPFELRRAFQPYARRGYLSAYLQNVKRPPRG